MEMRLSLHSGISGTIETDIAGEIFEQVARLIEIHLQDLLIRYTNLIKDVNDVRCSPNNGDDNSGKIVS